LLKVERYALRFIVVGESSNGRTPDSGSGYLGSNPSSPVMSTGGPIV
jgi:hypothetical protein